MPLTDTYLRLAAEQWTHGFGGENELVGVVFASPDPPDPTTTFSDLNDVSYLSGGKAYVQQARVGDDVRVIYTAAYSDFPLAQTTYKYFGMAYRDGSFNDQLVAWAELADLDGSGTAGFTVPDDGHQHVRRIRVVIDLSEVP